MNVETIAEGCFQRVDIGDMREQAQLDLGVVCGNQYIAVFRNEGFADFAALFSPDRNILKVRVC